MPTGIISGPGPSGGGKLNGDMSTNRAETSGESVSAIASGPLRTLLT